MANRSYAKQKLNAVVSSLEDGTGTVKDRLSRVFLNLDLIRDGIPSPYRSEYEAILESLSNCPDQGDGTVNATLAAMSDHEADDIAKRIYKLAENVADYE